MQEVRIRGIEIKKLVMDLRFKNKKIKKFRNYVIEIWNGRKAQKNRVIKKPFILWLGKIRNRICRRLSAASAQLVN